MLAGMATPTASVSPGPVRTMSRQVIGCPVEVAAERETTALGAAALAGCITTGVAVGARYEPQLSGEAVAVLRAAWASGLASARLVDADRS